MEWLERRVVFRCERRKALCDFSISRPQPAAQAAKAGYFIGATFKDDAAGSFSSKTSERKVGVCQSSEAFPTTRAACFRNLLERR
jgi:hypothetical protein